MARSKYIYTAQKATGQILWVGTVKHELTSFVKSNSHLFPMRVRRMDDGSQLGKPLMDVCAVVYLHNNERFV